MGRPAVQRAGRPRSRQARDSALIILAVLVVIFALIGVGSAAAYVAGKVSSGSTAPPTSRHHTSTSSSLAQAHSEATAIVRSARVAGRSIVSSASRTAHRSATAIVTAARKRAKHIVAAATPAPVAAVQPTQVLQPSSPPVVVATPVAQPTTAGAASAANLKGLPASWLVVAYNATFGTGPGSAGGVSVVNRSRHTFSGVVTVHYSRGGVATAPFSGLGPDQSVVLPLNGPRYPGGGFRILVSGLR